MQMYLGCPGRDVAFAQSLRTVATMLCVALIAAAMAGAPLAAAEPSGSGRPAESPTLGLRELSADPSMSFSGTQGIKYLNIPVPAGLRPVTLLGEVDLPVNVVSTNIAVIQGDRVISRVDLPPGDRAPIALPLDSAEVSNANLSVQVRINLVPPLDYCLYDDLNPLVINNLAVAYAGVELPPRDVADFLPPVLQRLTIFVPPTPSMTESDVAVRTAAAIVSRYAARSIQVGVLPLSGDDPLPPAEPFERQIVVREGGDAALTLLGSQGIPSLLISGPASDLGKQASLLTNGDATRLALTSSARVDSLKDPQVPTSDTFTLRELGQSTVSATALTSPRVAVGVNQTKLGRPARDVRVHLRGSYTPLPTQLNGQVVVTANGEVVDRWPVDGSGRIDREVVVPDRLLQRSVTIGVSVDATGTTGRCGGSAPLTLTIDADSTVSSSAATTPIPPGFQSLPQAFLPHFDVGIGDDALADTARAVSIVTGMQRLSAIPLDPTVRKLRDAMASTTPAVLISADKWTDNKVTLPVTASQRAMTLDGRTPGGDGTVLTLSPELRMGSLQPVRTPSRTILVATSNEAPEQLDALLRWFDADPTRWDGLSGSAIVAVPDRDPVIIPVKTPPAAEPEATQGVSTTTYWLVGAGVLAAVVLGIAAALVVRSRRRRVT